MGRKSEISPDFDIKLSQLFLIFEYQEDGKIRWVIWVMQACFLPSLGMFVRNKESRSGTVTIVIVDKSHG